MTGAKAVVVTQHAFDRLKERSGLTQKAATRIAQRAFEDGLSHADMTGKLKRYVNHLYLKQNKVNNPRVYGERIFLFNYETLVTVWNLPNELRVIANKLLKEKRTIGE